MIDETIATDDAIDVRVIDAPDAPTDFSVMTDRDFIGMPDDADAPHMPLIAIRVDQASGQVYYRVYHLEQDEAATQTANVAANMTTILAQTSRETMKRLRGVVSALTAEMTVDTPMTTNGA